MLVFTAIGYRKTILFLDCMIHILGGLLTPQTPPGADGKEDFYLLAYEKALSIKDNASETYLCWKV